MKKKPQLIIFFILITCQLTAQSSKYGYLGFCSYYYPKSYITKDYNSFSAEAAISEEPVGIIINGEQKGTRKALQFQEFLKKEDILRGISKLKDLTYLKESNGKEDHFIVDILAKDIFLHAEIKNANKTTLGQKYEKPFSYDLFYEYTVLYKLKNAATGKVINENKYQTKEGYRLGGIQSENPNGSKRLFHFKTEEEARNYLVKNIDSNLIFNEVIKGVKGSMSGGVEVWLDIYFQEREFFFCKISKQKKHPFYKKLNEEVQFLKDWTESKNKSQYKSEKIHRNQDFLSKNKMILNDKITGFKNPDPTAIGYKYVNNVTNVLADFIVKMENYSREFDTNDKKQKRAVWVCYMNIASSFQVLNNYQSSLEYMEKARALDYGLGAIKQFERRILEEKKNYDNFFNPDGVLKANVHEKYIKYLKI
jgi:hypothetical protein